MRKPMLIALLLLVSPAIAGAQEPAQAPGSTSAPTLLPASTPAGSPAPADTTARSPAAKPAQSARSAARSRSVLGQAFADLTQAAESRRAAATPHAKPQALEGSARPAPTQVAVQDPAH